MPVPPHRPQALQWQVFRGSEALRRHLLTADQLRSRAWRRLRNDVYADARLECDHQLACRAAALRIPVTAAVAGPSAAYLAGVRHAAAHDDPVHVIVPPDADFGPRQGLRVHVGHLDRHDVVRTAGVRRTAGPRTAWDVANWVDLVPAVAIVDALLSSGETDRAGLAELIGGRRGLRGWQRAEHVFALADPGAQSPPETHLRVRIVLAGLPRPVTQHPIALADGLVLHPDLAWPEWRVAVEYDGHWHAGRLHHDRRRLNRLVAAGWAVLHVTSRRLRHELPAVLREIREALTRAGWH